MFDLRDDGSLGIDFPNEDGTATTVRVRPVPTFGAYKRLRGELAALQEKQDEFARALREDPEVSVAAMTVRLNERYETDTLGWWAFVLRGDDTWKGLAEAEVPDEDAWPPYLTTNASINQALAHWKAVPLARGGSRILTSAPQ